MIAKRRVTPSRFFTLGAFLVLILLLLILSNHYPLDLITLPGFLRDDKSLAFLHNFKETFKSNRKANLSRVCDLFSLAGSGGKGTRRERLKGAQCQRVLPVPGSCDVADKLFLSSPPAQCDGQRTVEFCTVAGTNRGHSVQCSHSHCDSTLSGAVVNKHTGQLQWRRFDSPQTLEKWINSLLHPSSGRTHFGFCMIACGGDWTNVEGNRVDVQDDSEVYPPFQALQILLLPPQVPSVLTGRSHTHININFNLVFIDSVSHQHFFRSLPNTVKLLHDLSSNNFSGVTVLDFELVQAVRSRTFESLQVLFSGEVDPSVKPFGTLELPPEPLKTEALLKTLKERGYSTLWLEDLCYLWEWGISKDLLVLNKSFTLEQTWKKLQEALSQASIDSLEVTYAMCKVLSENGVKDHFRGPEVVCLNGRHQHDYLLDYLRLYQESMVMGGMPFFTFMETNVGHEGSGRRIQTFDQSFQRYLKHASKLKNTLTVIFSDHGNSYGTYLGKTMEGRMELFHPHIFMLVPDSVAAVLGPSAMEALRINQRRLVSHLDLHYMLQSLAHNHRNRVSEKHKQYQYDVSSEGLLKIISPNRTCHQIPRIMPNLCICQNFDMPADNDAYHALFAHMAIGRVNNEIQRQFLQQYKLSKLKPTRGFGRCRRLRLEEFDNVKKSFSGDTISLKMDLMVPRQEQQADDESDLDFDILPTSSAQMEIFFVSMLVRLRESNASRASIIMDMLDRITTYGKFSVCADPAVKLQLCVCDVNGTQKSLPNISQTSGLEYTLYLKPDVYLAEGTEECLQLIVKKNYDGGIFLVVNVCQGKVFHVLFSLQTSEMIVSDVMPQRESVFPGQEIFLCMAVKNAPEAEWNWSFTLHHQQQTL